MERLFPSALLDFMMRLKSRCFLRDPSRSSRGLATVTTNLLSFVFPAAAMQNNTVYAQPGGGGGHALNALKNSNVTNTGAYGVSSKPTGGYSSQATSSGVYQPKSSPSVPPPTVRIQKQYCLKILSG